MQTTSQERPSSDGEPPACRLPDILTSIPVVLMVHFDLMLLIPFLAAFLLTRNDVVLQLLSLLQEELHELTMRIRVNKNVIFTSSPEAGGQGVMAFQPKNISYTHTQNK